MSDDGETNAPDLTAQLITERVRSELFARPLEPVRLGRYALLGQVGQGAMGVVLAGYDETLERKVAIKIVHPHRAQTTLSRERMLREARAMARVSHLNVVHVYDAGEHQGRVYIGMEFVEGTTLRAWLRERPRSWRECVAMFVRVGEGLAAAHAVGVVHRDFKPDNVLVTCSGVPKVADFGLAQLQALHVLEDTAELTEGDDVTLTATGANVGTPLYRAPEQHEGRVADEKSDQFAFCVALYEALFHCRPFAGSSLAELRAAVVAGRRRPPPADVGVPGWVRLAVLRGLETDPARRHESMAALVSELSRDPRVKRRRIATVVAGTVLVGGGFGALALVDRPPPPCRDADAQIGTAWSDERRARLEGVLAAIDAGYAPETARRVGAALDEYATAWRTAYRDACEATRVHGHQSEALLDRRMACLEKRRLGLDAVAEVLEQTDEATLPSATTTALGLAAIDRCADVDYVGALAAPADDPEERRLADELMRDTERAAALLRAGRYVQAEATAIAIAERAEQLGQTRRHAEALYVAGRARLEMAQPDAARDLLQRAYHAADEAGDDERRGYAATSLIVVHAATQPTAPLPWIDHAWAALRRHGESAALELAVHSAIGTLRYSQGRFDDAIAEHRAALDLLAAANTEPLNQSAMHNEMGRSLVAVGRLQDALDEFRVAHRILDEALGADHPHVGMARDNVGGVLLELGRPDEALVQREAALEILENAFGADHPNVLMARANLGGVLAKVGRIDEALAIHRVMPEKMSAAFGPGHPNVAEAHMLIAEDLVLRGDRELALVELEVAIEIFAAALPADHPSLARAHTTAAECLAGLGRHEAAERHRSVR